MHGKMSTNKKNSFKRIPKVSILCSTYNHAGYIRQALDSFLMQKTDFDIEVLVNDDASDDGTIKIIKAYKKKYPGIIKPVFHKENLYSQGYRNMIMRFLLPKAGGAYIVLCEGDDFWTDPHKLQAQVDFLDRNPEYALCFHPVRVFFENSDNEDSVFPAKKPELTVSSLLKQNYIQTNSVMYRKQTYAAMPFEVMPGDWYLHLYHAQFGKIGFINKVMAAYRRHPGGIWWDAHSDRNVFWEKYAQPHFKLYKELLVMYGADKDKRDIIYARIDQAFAGITKSFSVKDRKRRHEIDLLKAKLTGKENTIKVQQSEIEMIKSSVSWRAADFINTMLGRKKP